MIWRLFFKEQPSHSWELKRFLNVIKYIEYRRTAILNDLCTFFFQIRLYYSPQLLRSSFEKSKGLTDKSPKNLFEKVKQLTAENCNACVTLGQFLSGK